MGSEMCIRDSTHTHTHTYTHTYAHTAHTPKRAQTQVCTRHTGTRIRKPVDTVRPGYLLSGLSGLIRSVRSMYRQLRLFTSGLEARGLNGSAGMRSNSSGNICLFSSSFSNWAKSNTTSERFHVLVFFPHQPILGVRVNFQFCLP